MPETGLEQFHFLRPAWLVIIPIAAWLYLRLRGRYNAAAQWRHAIAPHLVEYLVVGSGSRYQLRPFQLMTAALIVASIALAGPTWQREVTPFTEDRAPLVIALELTPTMLATDQPPTRLERAKHKIRDLLAQRQGARTALIAYAGSAHLVLPLTDDANLIETYLESLVPSIMPSEGDDAAAAMQLARDILATQQSAGTSLFISDGIDRTQAPAFIEPDQNDKNQLIFLVAGRDEPAPISKAGANGQDFGLIDGKAPGADIAGTRSVAEAAGGVVIRMASDSADVDAVARQVRTHLVNTIQDDERFQWHDFGYVLVWPLAFIILLWARRGWTVQWG